ncbi:hypothetical protein LZD49_04945 [Dyadobacter sp. CY261]|uniref:hypothetical protein n=1 Tax=Dyadobacter sp. CY261 TaxID=2907203 RepID=UPI001F45C286|nr:hypothetical protein [Dyadobacter sp. CY261]MCF0069808.1 hypothetical protein [Dyadobacter sp. CY261]
MKAKRLYWTLLIIICLASESTLHGCKNGGIFSRETTIFGTVTEIAGHPVDSVQFVISAYKDLGNTKGLYRVTSDADGNYEAIVDAPKGYTGIGITVAGVDNPAFHLVYRGYDVYKEGKKVNYCCTVKAGGKTRYDFKVYK